MTAIDDDLCGAGHVSTSLQIHKRTLSMVPSSGSTSIVDPVQPPEFPWRTWEEDHRDRLNPGLLTRLLQDAVPMLRFSDWQVLETREGYARTLLPLTSATTNHQGTHQAAVMLMTADYTGAIALGSVLRGFPITGVHPPLRDWPSDRATGWLVRSEIEYTTPSTADLLATCCVPANQIHPTRERFFAGRPTVVPLEVSLESEGAPVARARMTYYVRRSSFLKTSSSSQRPNVLHEHSRRSSARLVAGLRAREQTRSTPLFADRYSASLAGAHGRLLAEQFSRLLPQLVDMVAARTRDADDCLRETVQRGVRQVVLIGAGLDCRPFRLLAGAPGITVFELDLPSMLQEREQALAKLADVPYVYRVPVAIDLERQDVAQSLMQNDRFDPWLATIFLLEGVSMYLQEETLASVLRSIGSLMTDPNSRLWLDVVHASVVDGTAPYPGVDRFVSEMGRMGEPFVFGLDSPATYFAGLGLQMVRTVSSGKFCSERTHPIFSLYSFHTLSAPP